MKLTYKTRSLAMIKFPRTAFIAPLVAVAMFLSGCGGGSGAGSAGAGSATTAPTSALSAATLKAKSVVILTSQPNLPSDGKTSTTITVLVKDEGNRALAKAIVDLTSTDPGVVIQQASTETAADGSVTATVTSTSKNNRLIPIKATVGANTASLNIPVAGTTVTLSGPLSLPFSGSGDFTVVAKDSSGLSIPNTDVVIKSSAGNTITPATVKTDSNGQASFKVTVAKSGADTITADAAGSSGSVKLSVASTLLTFTGVTPAEDVIVNTVKNAGILITENGNPVVSKSLSVNATRGLVVTALGGGRVVTDAAGRATFDVSSADAGPSTLTVSDAAGGVVTTAAISFISTTPNVIKLQASPATVGSNAIGTSGNASQLLANVKDATGNPVKGVVVNFSTDADPSNGNIQPSSAVTDSSGNATVAFVAGPNVTGPDQVVLRAKVNGTLITNTASLTVASRQVSIRLGTGNQIEIDGPTRYKFPWTAVVVDSSGSPIAGALVTVQVVPLGYYKGSWIKRGGVWGVGAYVTDNNGIETPLGNPTITEAVYCSSEDTSPADSNLQAGEDKNNNGKLDPGNVATTDVAPSGRATGANGFIDFNIVYAKSFSLFTKVRIDVRVQVSGTESVVSEIFILPMEAGDASGSAPPTTSTLAGPFGEIVTNQFNDANGVPLNGGQAVTACNNKR
jgi:Bacterial Ig-like domain (group 1)